MSQTPQIIPTHLCSVTVTLAPSLSAIPLLGGGTRILSPITGGTITGAGFNGTIDGGLSAAIHLDDHSHADAVPKNNNNNNNDGDSNSNDGTTADKITKLALIHVYGHADDGSPFYIEEAGIGAVEKQNTRVILQVGGRYAPLQEAFLLGQPGREPVGSGARVECWVVPL
ncbi:hypothetical protein BJX68DRAFT_271843 [Aspergillus pseudodeflectus]|uniref:Uncharacterized protein n=1 Tax=Aspergillus pseudodeflectus TaxID=176178 RepID=A0ABR4JJG4_9EURO